MPADVTRLARLVPYRTEEGKDISAALGEWSARPEMDDHTEQAEAVIAPGVVVRYTGDEEEDWLELIGSCTACGNNGSTRVDDARSLAAALTKAGLDLYPPPGGREAGG